MSGFQEQVQELTARLQEEQAEKTYLKSRNEKLEKDVSDMKERLGRLESQLAEKDAALKKAESEVMTFAVREFSKFNLGNF